MRFFWRMITLLSHANSNVELWWDNGQKQRSQRRIRIPKSSKVGSVMQPLKLVRSNPMREITRRRRISNGKRIINNLLNCAPWFEWILNLNLNLILNRKYWISNRVLSSIELYLLSQLSHESTSISWLDYIPVVVHSLKVLCDLLLTTSVWQAALLQVVSNGLWWCLIMWQVCHGLALWAQGSRRRVSVCLGFSVTVSVSTVNSTFNFQLDSRL